MVVYSPIYKDDSYANIYLKPHHMYSDIFATDNTSIRAGSTGLSKTWEDRELHAQLVAFATKCHDALASRAGMEWAVDILMRVDIIVLLKKVCEGDEEGCEYDTSNSTLLMNELDNFGSASLLVDLCNPARDGLVPMRTPGGTKAVAPRSMCQEAWVQKLRRRLSTLLFGNAALQIAWGRGNSNALH